MVKLLGFEITRKDDDLEKPASAKQAFTIPSPDDGTTLKSYTYRGLFPISLDSIALNYNTNDTIEEFGVTFQFQYFETDTTT